MEKREWMIKIREMMGYTTKEMSEKADCSELLLRMVEGGHTTVPGIAARIAACYGMSVDEFNQLVPEKRRCKTLPVPKKIKKRGGKHDG